MGKIKAGIDSSMIGKVGPHVYRMWKGRNVAAILPASVHNPNTNKQKLVRVRFKAAVQTASDMFSAIRLGLAQRAKQYRFTESNYFVRVNWDAISASSPDDVTVDYSEITIAEGSIKKVTATTIDWGTTEHLTIAANFTDNTGDNADANDDVYMFAYVPELNEGITSTASTRSTGSVSIAAPASWNGMSAHVWLFCVGQGTATFGKDSDSSYAGHDEIQ